MSTRTQGVFKQSFRALPGSPAMKLSHSKTSLPLEQYFHGWYLYDEKEKPKNLIIAFSIDKNSMMGSLQTIKNKLFRVWGIVQRSHQVHAASSKPSAQWGCARRNSHPPSRSRSGPHGDKDPAGSGDSRVWFWNIGLYSPSKCAPDTSKTYRTPVLITSHSRLPD